MPREPEDVPEDILASVLLEPFRDPERERRAMRAAGVRLVVLGDTDYPPLLAAIPDPPRALWCRGDLAALGALPVAIVGSRRATSYGVAQAGAFAARLAEFGHAIVSGGARGVDAEAHRAALRAGGATVAVVGCGLGAGPYPPEHAPLYEAIVSSGGLLLSELPTAYPVRPDNFPRRNRIISGVSACVVVVEAAPTSGALITARIAVGDHNRTAFALPGPLGSARSEGCNRAIHDGEAMMALSPDEVHETLMSEGLLLAAGSRAASAGRGTEGAAPRADRAAPAHAEGFPPDVLAAVPRVRALLRREPDADAGRIVEETGLPVHAAHAARTLAEMG
jgi:DNA processing protein